MAQSILVYLIYKSFSWMWAAKSVRWHNIAFVGFFIACVILVFKLIEYFDRLLYSGESTFGVLIGLALLGLMSALGAGRFRVALLVTIHAWLACAMAVTMLFLYSA